MKDANNSLDLVVVEEVKNDTVILKTGTMCHIVMVGGINFLLRSPEEQNAIALAYQDFLNGLDFSLQIIVHSRKINIENYLKNLEVRRESEISPLLQNQITEYQKFIESFVRDNAIMRKIFLAVVPYYPSVVSASAAASMIPFLKKKETAEQAQKSEKEKEEEFQKNLLQLEQRTNQVIEGLRTIGLEARLLVDEELVELFYNYYNPETVEKNRIPQEK